MTYPPPALSSLEILKHDETSGYLFLSDYKKSDQHGSQIMLLV